MEDIKSRYLINPFYPDGMLNRFPKRILSQYNTRFTVCQGESCLMQDEPRRYEVVYDWKHAT
jgi:hypothetical protein